MKFCIDDFFGKCDQILRKNRIWSHLLKKSLMENFFFMQWISQRRWRWYREDILLQLCITWNIYSTWFLRIPRRLLVFNLIFLLRWLIKSNLLFLFSAPSNLEVIYLLQVRLSFDRSISSNWDLYFRTYPCNGFCKWFLQVSCKMAWNIFGWLLSALRRCYLQI